MPDLHSMLLQVRDFVARKGASLEALRRREADVERMLAAVRAEIAAESCTMQSAQGLELALQQRVQQQESRDQQPQTDVAEQPGSGEPLSARDAVRRAIREFLLEREEATTREIRQHIQRVLPEVNVKNTSPELTHLFQQGVVVRPRLGVYQLGGEWAMPSHH
ncbi:hypothetical protein ACIO13_23740 [Streptomyces sp. NPDC087425]|uniref:hypothetical protein n=1 Tax=Streptomyces sp. NPDC087425 TaxID=3365787 RepID=UPI0037F2A9EB